MIELFRNLLCVAGGVALGYYLAYIRLDAKYTEQADQKSEEFREYYRKRYEDKITQDTEMVNQAAESMTKYAAAKQDVEDLEALTNPAVKAKLLEEIKKPAEPKVVADKKSLIQTPPKMNYNHISTPPKVTEATEEASEDEDEVQIEFITKQDFIEDQFGYKQIMLTYWTRDDVLSNELEQPILGSARDVSVGADAIAKLKAGEKQVFVRNRSGKWEFEITREDQVYEDVVGPITMNPDTQIDATE